MTYRDLPLPTVTWQTFVHAGVLLPLLQLCSTWAVAHQHALLLALSLWLRHSDAEHNQIHNQIALAQQRGCAQPPCNHHVDRVFHRIFAASVLRMAAKVTAM